MKLLFNKQAADFSQEIKDTLAFIDADFPFKKIKPDLRTATAQFIEVVGKEVYADLYAIYTESNEAPAETEAGDNAYLIELAQYAIATAAYRLFAPSNDLKHGVNGRTMLSTEDDKTPFEHMLVASNDEMERRSFRAMNDFLKVLDDLSDTWKESDAYKESHRLFVRTTADFDRFFVINSRILLLKLQPALALAEKREIIPRVTRDVFETMKAKRNGTSETALTDKEAKLLPLIQEACVYTALAWGIVRLQATLFPEGVLQPLRGERTTIKGRAAFLGNQIDQLEQKFNEDAAEVLKEIESVMQPEVEETASLGEQTSEEDLFGFDADSNFVST